jgi:divalent metal cation (Fe/Co/Zn/Cd) transporter
MVYQEAPGTWLSGLDLVAALVTFLIVRFSDLPPDEAEKRILAQLPAISQVLIHVEPEE